MVGSFEGEVGGLGGGGFAEHLVPYHPVVQVSLTNVGRSFESPTILEARPSVGCAEVVSFLLISDREKQDVSGTSNRNAVQD